MIQTFGTEPIDLLCAQLFGLSFLFWIVVGLPAVLLVAWLYTRKLRKEAATR